MKISIINKKTKKNVTLKSVGEHINVSPMNWVSIKFLDAGYLSIICDRKYSKRDYNYDLNKIIS